MGISKVEKVGEGEDRVAAGLEGGAWDISGADDAGPAADDFEGEGPGGGGVACMSDCACVSGEGRGKDVCAGIFCTC